MNQPKTYFLAVLSCMVFVLFTNSNGQSVERDPNEPNLRRVGTRLPTLDAEFRAAIPTGDLSQVKALQAELGILLSTVFMTSEQHKKVADMVIEHRLAGMLPALAENLNRSIWPGSSMRAYTAQYPLTRAIVAFGQHSLRPVTEQLLKSREWYEVEVLAYCLLGIQGAEDAGKTLQDLQRQVSDKELRDMLLRTVDWIIRYNELYMVDFTEDKIPRIPEDEMLFVPLPDEANATLDESRPTGTPPKFSTTNGKASESGKSLSGQAKTPSEEPTSSTPWSIIVVLIVAATGLLWLLVKKRK
jgi:hypothetical protein